MPQIEGYGTIEERDSYIPKTKKTFQVLSVNRKNIPVPEDAGSGKQKNLGDSGLRKVKSIKC